MFCVCVCVNGWMDLEKRASHCSLIALRKIPSNTKQAGMMDEMVQDVMAMGDEDDIEEEADAEVDKVLFEMTDGLLGQAGQVGEELQVRDMRAFFFNVCSVLM